MIMFLNVFVINHTFVSIQFKENSTLVLQLHGFGILLQYKLTNHKMWSHYNNFDSAYSEIADLIVAPTNRKLKTWKRY